MEEMDKIDEEKMRFSRLILNTGDGLDGEEWGDENRIYCQE